MKSKKIAVIVMILALPVLPFLKVYQAYRQYTLEKSIMDLETVQRERIERNKLLEANIAIYGSPLRIDKLASEMDGIGKLDPERIVHVKLTGDTDMSRGSGESGG